MTLKSNIEEAIRDATGCANDRLGLHEPLFEGNEWDYVKECIDTAWVSSAGKYVDRFERDLAEYTGADRAVAVVNGTSALHIALQLIGVEETDEVLVPTLTFVATANAVRYTNATPHFIDSEPETLGIAPDKLRRYLADNTSQQDGICHNSETGRPIRVLVAMHTFGHPNRIKEIRDVCNAHNITLVEDAAESLGSLYEDKHTGRFGRIGILSFNGNKTITTGGGGAIITDDEDLADEAKHLTTTAKVDHPWEYRHDRVGYNYRLPNLNAALGCAQLESLPNFVERKRRLAGRYSNVFADLEDVEFVSEPDKARSNYWLNAIKLNSQRMDKRDDIIEYTNDHGVQTRPIWQPLHTLPMYKNAPHMDLSQAENLAARIINIPSSAFLIS